MLPLCKIKAELVVAYDKASATYLKAAAELSHYAGTIPEVEFERLSVISQRARNACREAREALRAHVSQHHCEYTE